MGHTKWDAAIFFSGCDFMPPLSVLVKPSSSACDLKCTYCFYRDEAQSRKEAFFGMMSEETAERLIVRAFELAEKSCGFLFQGGEPTLSGLEFFNKFISLVKKHNTNNLKISYSIQTNGITLYGEWADFFKREGFLVGISLDGPSDIHDLNRFDGRGNGTFKRVMSACELLKKHGVEFNILSVVTSRSVRSPEKLFAFYKKHGFPHLQLIPCISPCEGKKDFSPAPADYGRFLIKLFDLWYGEISDGNYISIRLFENMLSVMSGQEPEECGMRGHCGIQFVCEGNGNIYPCDFYALDEYLLGNVYTDRFSDMILSEKGREFIKESAYLPEKCKKCEWVSLCRNGCKKYRVFEEADGTSRYKYCESYKMFFENRAKELSYCLKNLLSAN